MTLTEAQARKLAVFLDAIDVDQNEFDGSWFWWTLGRNGFNSTWWCRQAPAGHAYTTDECDRLGLPHGSISEGPATVSLDSLDPRLFALERGAAAAGRKFIAIDARTLVMNPQGSNIVLALSVYGTEHPVPIRLNGMNLSIPIPAPHGGAETVAFAQAFAQTTKHRRLTNEDLHALARQFPGPTWTDDEWDDIRAAIDRLP